MRFIRDIRLAGRSLRRSPLLSITTIGTLAVGIALVSIQLAVVNAYLLRSVPYANSDRIYHIVYAPPGPDEPWGMSDIDWNSLRDVVDATIAYSGESWYIRTNQYATYTSALRVVPGFIRGLGIQPVIGHVFDETDYTNGGADEALISYAMWEQRFSKDPDILNKSLTLTGEDGTTSKVVRVAGVLPETFWFGRTSDTRPDLILPSHKSDVRAYMLRLRAGVDRQRAEQRLTEAVRKVGTHFPTGWNGVTLESVHDRYVADMRPLLHSMTLAAALLLLLVCANVSILILLRSLRRQRELAVHMALGAGRSALLSILTSEAVLLTLISFVMAGSLAWASLRGLAPLIEARIGRPPPSGPGSVQVDSHVLMLMAAAGIGVALMLSLVPLFAAGRGQIAKTLRQAGRATTDSRLMQRVRAGLIAIEVAGALVLLTGGGLMLRTVINLVRTDIGFDATHVARIRVTLPASITSPEGKSGFYQHLSARLGDTNSDYAVSTSSPPFYETFKEPLESDDAHDTQWKIGNLAVGANYFRVRGIRVESGREFSASDRYNGVPVAIISASLAKAFWPAGNAIGARLRTIESTDRDATPGPWRTVVGVVKDVRQTYDDNDLRDVYLPYLQVPTRYASIEVRAGAITAPQVRRVPEIVNSINPLVRVADPVLLSSEDAQLARAKFVSGFIAWFAVFATLLVLLGIFGITAYAVSRREREIAIRMAVGAPARSIVSMFLNDGARLVAIGIAAGGLTAVAATRVLQSQLHGVRTFDVLTIGCAALFLAGCSLASTWWAARQAASSRLLNLLREE